MINRVLSKSWWFFHEVGFDGLLRFLSTLEIIFRGDVVCFGILWWLILRSVWQFCLFFHFPFLKGLSLVLLKGPCLELFVKGTNTPERSGFSLVEGLGPEGVVGSSYSLVHCPK